ncbi:catalase [Fusarium coicis]|nr:catalase [Fusarium coicis]
MQGANEGPADVIAKVSGAKAGGKREDDGAYFTNNEGIPFPDPAHSKTVGGLPLISDTFLLQKQQTFNRSKNFEHMVHPCGSGAFGYFECTQDVTELTTPFFVRFSTVTLGREFPNEARNPRGFAIKFYTMEGNYDIVGLNFPVFFAAIPFKDQTSNYAQGIYNLLCQPQFEFSKVKELAETAQEWYKEPKFRPVPGSKLAGYPPSSAVYQT